MIPLKLQLKNFLSYGAELQTIDFSPYRLICLSGKNGHGKSALLDAVTWALWGHARKVSGTAKPDQGLLRLGQTQMLVIFDFKLHDTIYRVRREFLHTFNKPYVNLEFGVVDTLSDRLMPLTDKTIRDTQEKINTVLRLDFEAFTNSAFLRQGESNEFSKKSPKDRKEVFANILGLTQFEFIRRQALDKIRNITVQKQTLESLQQSYTQEAARLATTEQILQTLEIAQQNLTQQESTLQQSKNQLDERYAWLIQQQKQRDIIAYALQQCIHQEESTKALIKEGITTWRSVHKKQLQQKNIPLLEHEKKTIIERINQFQKLLQQELSIKEQLLTSKETLQTLQQKHREQHGLIVQEETIAYECLIAEKNNIETKIKELEKQRDTTMHEHMGITQEIIVLQQLVTQQVPLVEEIQQHELLFEKRKSLYQHCIMSGNILKNELRALEQKKNLVHTTDNPSCPLCEQNLSASRKRFLKGQLDEQESWLHHRLQRITTIITRLKPLLFEQHAAIDQLKKQLVTLHQTQAKLETIITQEQKILLAINQVQHDIKQYQERLASLEHLVTEKELTRAARIAQHQKKIEDNTQYRDCLTQMKMYEQQLSNFRYDASAHQQAQHDLNHIEQQLLEYGDIQKQAVLQYKRAQEINAWCNMVRSIRTQKNELIEQNKAYSALADQEKIVHQEQQKLEQEWQHLQTQRELFLKEKACAQAQQVQLHELQEKITYQNKTIKLLHETIDEYHTIANAMGKDGIQALLIEEAIPEIEQEANNLLAKLTNNQAQLFIESLRDLKKGGTKETLDIKISDAIGIRPYELFSGGEAFRIDFALRIAISRLLARRAGTTLQTLIIDEGFGSQDEEGLAYIMDAIYKIQDDFSKIIIVSHLTSMKDQFPVHFFIEKGPQGSRIQIIEHE